MSELSELAEQIPKHIIIEKKLWDGSISVNIDHIDNDPSKPLDYVGAFKNLLDKLEDK